MDENRYSNLRVTLEKAVQLFIELYLCNVQLVQNIAARISLEEIAKALANILRGQVGMKVQEKHHSENLHTRLCCTHTGKNKRYVGISVSLGQ
jgi:hypothetical protein